MKVGDDEIVKVAKAGSAIVSLTRATCAAGHARAGRRSPTAFDRLLSETRL
jgi:hypothetical protein